MFTTAARTCSKLVLHWLFQVMTLKAEGGEPIGGTLVYREADYAFDTEPRPSTSGSSFTVNELELMLDDEEEGVLFVTGYCPHVGWRRAKLRAPLSRPGLLRGQHPPEAMAGGAVALNAREDRWPVLVDERNGWVRLGHGDPNMDREAVNFAPGAIAVLDAGHLVALWLRPEKLPLLPEPT